VWRVAIFWSVLCLCGFAMWRVPPIMEDHHLLECVSPASFVMLLIDLVGMISINGRH
jgi:hypothetical protein